MATNGSNDSTGLPNLDSDVPELNVGMFGSIKEDDLLQKQKLMNDKTKVELRKKKFQEQLSKNRTADFDDCVDSYSQSIASHSNGASSIMQNLESNSQTSTITNMNSDYFDFDAISQTLKTKSISDAFILIQRIRKVLSNHKKSAATAHCFDDLVKSPFLSIITDIMRNSQDELLNYEIAWILINVAAGTTQQTEAIVTSGAMEMLMEKMKQPQTEKIKSHILWIFANVIGDGPNLRNKCLDLGILPLIHDLVFHPTPQSQNINHHLAWIISNILRPTNQEVSDEVLQVILLMLEKLISLNPDSDVIFDIIWSLFYMQTSVQRRGIIIHRKLHLFLIEQLNNTSEKNQKASLRALSVLTMSSNEDMQILLDDGILDYFAHIFETKPDFFKRDVLLAFGNIAIGFLNQKYLLISHKIFSNIINRASAYSDHLQSEISFIIANLILTNDVQFLKELLEQYPNVYELFFHSIISQTGDVALILRNLSAAYMLLMHQENLNRDIALMMEKEGVLEAIENFQLHKNEDVYKKSTEIIQNFFTDGEIADDNLGIFNPNNDNGNNNESGNRFNF